MYADLHLHTTASDGELTPTELVGLAISKGYKTIAITDHDSTEGIEEALAAGEKKILEIIPGIELSTLHENREIHLLGYYLDWKNKKLQDVLALIRAARFNRAENIVEKGYYKFGKLDII